MAAVVKRYAPQGIQDYEVWNEPGNPGFWHDSPGNLKPNAAHYTNLLKLAYKAAHDAAPDVNVLAGGMTVGETRSSDGYIDPRDFLEQMYAAPKAISIPSRTTLTASPRANSNQTAGR